MFQSLGNFEIDEIKVFVDITLSTINNANASSVLSGGHWRQTLYMLHVRKQPIVLCICGPSDECIYVLKVVITYEATLLSHNYQHVLIIYLQ